MGVITMTWGWIPMWYSYRYVPQLVNLIKFCDNSKIKTVDYYTDKFTCQQVCDKLNLSIDVVSIRTILKNISHVKILV